MRLPVLDYAAADTKLAILIAMFWRANDRTTAIRAANFERCAAGIRAIGVPLYVIEAHEVGTYLRLPQQPGLWRLTQPAPAKGPWQKERLLNLLAQRVPDRYEALAWLDADITYDDQSWAYQTEQMLQHYAVIQLFDKMNFLDQAGQSVRQFSAYPSDGHDRNVGFGWGYQRQIWEALGGLYELGGAGAADAIMAEAFVRTSDYQHIAVCNTPSGRAWSALAERTVLRHRCGWLRGVIGTHHWHCDFNERRYSESEVALRDARFDPDRDLISHSANWYLEWRRPELARAIARRV